MQLLRILIVEDDEDDFFLLNEQLKNIDAWTLNTKWVSNYEAAIEALCSNSFTLCFSDYRLGVRNGIELIREAQERQSNTPIILLTGKGTHKIDLEATKAGAFDYLIKDELDEDKLERTIRYSLERMHNLEKLKSSEHRYRSFFEKSMDIVFIAEADTTIITINAAVAELLKFSAEDCIGRKKITDFFQDEKSKEVFKDLLNKEGEVENFEVKLLSNDKESKTALINASFENKANKETYIQGIIHDITDMKKAELAAMQNEKLAATKRFIHTLAHEVRNPLKNIKMAVQQLLNPNNKINSKVLLEIVDRSEVKIDNLITELLQSSTVTAINMKRITLLPLLENVVASVADKAMLRNVELITDYGDVGFDLDADAAKLEMAILNILVNAIEAVQDGVGKVAVSFRKQQRQGILQIRDNGVGISEESIGKLFEPYFTSKHNGIGLGLATTFNILKVHNARIEVDSEIGQGTVFRVIFTMPSISS